MKKILHLSCCILSLLLFSSSYVFAATGAATVYKVVVTKFEMFNGTSWVTVSTGNSTTMDIASVDVGASVGNLFAGLDVPDGSYTQVRPTISGTFVVSGVVDGRYTDGGNSGSVCSTSADEADLAECTLTVTLGAPEADTLPTTLVVANGIPSHTVQVNFDVSAGLTDEDVPANTIITAEPSVTMQMIAN